MKQIRFVIIFICCVTNLALATTEANPEVNQKPRIIALAPHIVEMLYSFGAGDQIVGTLEFADYPVAAKNIPRIGNYARLQIEKVLQLKPDIIIAWRTGNPPEDLARLAKFGLKIVYSHPVELIDVAKEIKLFAKLTGHAEAGEIVANEYSEKLNNIKKSYQHKTPVTAFYELWSRPLTTVAGKAWPQQQLELCGINNPFKAAKSDYPQLGIEQVLTKLPRIIIQPTTNGRVNKDAMDWSQYPQIPAVKNGFMLSPNADQLHRMTPRLLDELTSLCKQVDDIRQFYQ